MHPGNYCFSLLQIHFTFLLSSLLKQTNISSFVGFLLHILFGALGFLMLFEKLPRPLEWILNLFSPFAFTAGLATVSSIIKPVHKNKSSAPQKFLQRTAKSTICIARTTQSAPLCLTPKKSVLKDGWTLDCITNLTATNLNLYKMSSGMWLVGTKGCRSCEGWKCCLCKATSAWLEIQLTEAFLVLVVRINPQKQRRGHE